MSDTRAPATLYGETCSGRLADNTTCGRSATFTAPTFHLPPEDVRRLLILAGWAVASGKWHCEACSRRFPSARTEADYDRHVYGAIAHNLSSADLELVRRRREGSE